MSKSVILFVTTVYEDIKNGPARYARYLNDHLYSNNDFEFKLIYNTSSSKNPFNIYYDVCTELQREIDKYNKLNYRVIVHYNIPQIAIKKPVGAHRIIVQINDYEQSQLYYDIRNKLRVYGVKKYFSYFIRRFIEKKTINISDVVVCNSIYTKESICSNYNTDPDKCTTVYKSVSLEMFNENNRRVDIEPLKIVAVGGDWKRKGFDLLLESCKSINKYHPIELNIYGVTDISFKRIVDQYGFAKSLGVIDPEQLSHVLPQHNLYILPSRHEALGVSILEGMASGLFAMGSNVGGIPEIIEDGVSGILFNPDDKLSIINAIDKYLSLSVVDKEKYLLEAKTKVELFSTDKMISTIKGIYCDLLRQ
ncbi:glycosyltransferase family 4 protein [Vibrio breoganii]